MTILLDTQIFLWFLADSARLSRPVRHRIRDATVVCVSAASIWEVAIKSALGKLRIEPKAVLQGIPASGFEELPVLARHAVLVAALAPHHRDPFDRLLVAQAMADSLRLLTADALLGSYGDPVEVV